MFSTVKLLKHSTCVTSYIRKECVRKCHVFHIINTPRRKGLTFIGEKRCTGVLSCIKFASTDSAVPDPPAPPNTGNDLQVLTEEEESEVEPITQSPTNTLEDSPHLNTEEINEALQGDLSLEDLPEIPSVPTELLGEPSFASVGLGGWGPVGLVQNCMEFFHVSCDLPWWTSIVVGTIIVRTLIFPLVIISQRNAAKMNNHLPQIQLIQLKLSDARERGDKYDAARQAQELLRFMSEKGLNPIKNMLVPLAQAPLFISFFLGLRGMATLPVESMREGGMLWFVDLTVPDQFYLLPIITSATLALTIEIGTDAARLKSANLGLMKYVLRALPVIILPFTVGFPSGILVYWASSNFISLVQVSFLRIPAIREYFKIEKLIEHDKKTLPVKDKGFVKGVKDSWTNIKLTREMEERQRIDEINFIRAGRGAVKKTFKFDPTQLNTHKSNTLQAKKRD